MRKGFSHNRIIIEAKENLLCCISLLASDKLQVFTVSSFFLPDKLNATNPKAFIFVLRNLYLSQ